MTSDPAKAGSETGPPQSTTSARALLALGSLLVFVLFAEGLLSFAVGRTLRELWEPARPLTREWLSPTEKDRWLAAARNPGPWRVHTDPLVGFTLRTDAEVEVFGKPVRTDALGMRRRPAAESSPDADAGDALRILVLGDSVAFGWGVGDEETLAHRLEVHLSGLLKREVICRTVAIPGWNHRNAVHFLLDHLDELPADLVLYMPINNDLADTYGVAETGHRREAPDIANPDPWLRVSTDQAHFIVIDTMKRLEQAGRLDEVSEADLGPPILNADLSPESSRRLDENAASIRLLAATLRARGTGLLLLQYAQQPYFWHLWARLADENPPVNVVPLLRRVAARFTLPSNPHPSAETHDIFARWVLGELLASGWLEDVDPVGLAALPPVPSDYEEARAPHLGPTDWRAKARISRDADRSALVPGIRPVVGAGLRQVYGGLQAGRVADRRMLALLPDPGRRGALLLRVTGLPERPDLYPLTLRVQIDGQPLGELVVPAEGQAEARWPVPSRGVPREVLIVADGAVISEYSGRLRMASYRLERLSLTPAR